MRKRTGGIALAALLIAGPVAAQQDEQEWLRSCQRDGERSSRAVHCEIRAASTTLAGGRLSVDAGPNGGVIVRGGDVRGVEISARVQARGRSDAEARAVAQGMRVHAEAGRVRADAPHAGQGTSWSVTYYVTVPRRADLELATVNGPVAVHDVSGQIRARTTNGPLRLERLAGDVDARTSNGPLSVVLSGSRWDGAGISAETRNGPVTLVVPESYSAELQTGTINGPLNLDFPVTVTMSGRRTNRIETTLGSGGPPVRVVSTNGPATVRRP